MIIERGLGGAATVLLGAVGFVLAIGHYDVNAYLWLEGAFVFGTILLIVALLLAVGAAAARAAAAAARAPARRAAAARRSTTASTTTAPTRGLLLKVFVFTTVIQAVRILSIWASCKAVGIDLGPRIYYVMGPLFFLVLLVPFTLNGFAVREAFFVSFLGSVGVDCRRGLRRRLPLLPRHGRSRCAGRRDPALGVGARRGPPRGGAWLTPARRRHDPQRAAVDRAVPRERRRASRPSSSTTTRATAPSRSCGSGSPPSRVVEQANRGLAAGWARGLEEVSASRWVLILNADAWLVGRRARADGRDR